MSNEEKQKMGEGVKRKDKEVKNSFLKEVFFNSKILIMIGIICVIVSLLINEKCKYFECYILASFLSTFGVSLIFCAIFTIVASTEQFMNIIENKLKEIIISRNFIKNMNTSDKEQVINSIIEPTTRECNIYPNIRSYYDIYIRNTLEISNKSIRYGYNINATAYIRDNRVEVESKFIYRLYPGSEGYETINIGYSTGNQLYGCECKKFIVKSSKDILISLQDIDDDKFKDKDNKQFKIMPITLDKYNSYEYLDIEFDLIEKGHDHWISLSYFSLQPSDKFDYNLKCEDGLIIADSVMFFLENNYNFNISEDKKRINVTSSQWINEGSGFALVISRLQNGEASVEESSEENFQDGGGI